MVLQRAYNHHNNIIVNAFVNCRHRREDVKIVSEAFERSRSHGKSSQRFYGGRVRTGIAIQGTVHAAQRRRLARFR